MSDHPYGKPNTKELMKQIKQLTENRNRIFLNALNFYWKFPALYLRDFGSAAVVRNTYIWKANIDRRKKNV